MNQKGTLRRLDVDGLTVSICVVVIALTLCISYQPAKASGIQHPVEQGVFLVATRDLADPRFRHSVILVTDYGKDGTAGLIINRPTNISLSEALPSIRSLKSHAGELFFGGPVQPSSVSILTALDSERRGMKRVLDGVFFSINADTIRGLGSGSGIENSMRVYAGYAGWRPGQLENEISRGDWLVVPGNGTLVFQEDASKLWRNLITTWDGLWL